ILQGLRGGKAADQAALVDVILRFAELCVDLGALVEEIDVNPLVVFESGRGACAVDCLIVRAREGGAASPRPAERAVHWAEGSMGMVAGKVALVTGAGRGIGRGIALGLAESDARVVVNDLGASLEGEGVDRRPADQVVEEIRAVGGQAVASYGSVADFREASEMVEQAVAAFGRIDILVNVAGILRDRMIFNMTEAEWDAVIAVHLTGTFNTTRAASARMREQRGGRIISMSSVSALGAPGQPNYAAAKAGIL